MTTALLIELGEFLLSNSVLIGAVERALASGASKEAILAGIEATMVAASEAAVIAEIGPRPVP